MFQDILSRVVGGNHLTRDEAKRAMQVMMSGEASEAQMGALLTALKLKGETSDEITGFAETMRNNALQVPYSRETVIDTCGTGGDGKSTFNVSTTAAFVLAGAGLAVAKHGNRGMSSACGSADVLTELGINVNVPATTVGKAIDEIGIGFLFAPLFHQAMKYVAKPRKELGFRTVFNLLGPLTNPARADIQLVGVYDPSVTAKVAEALAGLGAKRAMVVHSFDGMDEISTAVPTQIVEVHNGQISSYILDPAEYGFTPPSAGAYRGGDAFQNAAVVRSILEGQPGPKRDIVLINAGAALMIAGKAEDIREGIALAAASLDQGAALAKLEELKQFNRQEAIAQ
jgi:anthranilate phosphoribosyltransferase